MTNAQHKKLADKYKAQLFNQWMSFAMKQRAKLAAFHRKLNRPTLKGSK